MNNTLRTICQNTNITRYTCTHVLYTTCQRINANKNYELFASPLIAETVVAIDLDSWTVLYTGVHIQRPLATQLIPNASQSFDKKRSSPYPHLTIGRIELSRESQRESRARTPSHSKTLPAPTLSDSLPLRVSVYLLSARPPVQNWQDIVVDGLTMELAKRMPCHTIPYQTIP